MLHPRWMFKICMGVHRKRLPSETAGFFSGLGREIFQQGIVILASNKTIFHCNENILAISTDQSMPTPTQMTLHLSLSLKSTENPTFSCTFTTGSVKLCDGADLDAVFPNCYCSFSDQLQSTGGWFSECSGLVLCALYSMSTHTTLKARFYCPQYTPVTLFSLAI